MTDPIRNNGEKNTPAIGFSQPTQPEYIQPAKNDSKVFNPFGIRNTSKLIRKFVDSILTLTNHVNRKPDKKGLYLNISQITSKAKLEALKENLAGMENFDCGEKLIQLSEQLKLKIKSGKDLNSVKFVTPQWLDRRLEEYVGNAGEALTDKHKQIVGKVVQNLLEVSLLQCQNRSIKSKVDCNPSYETESGPFIRMQKNEADAIVDIIRNHEKNISEENLIGLIENVKSNHDLMLLMSVENKFYINSSLFE